MPWRHLPPDHPGFPAGHWCRQPAMPAGLPVKVKNGNERLISITIPW